MMLGGMAGMLKMMGVSPEQVQGAADAVMQDAAAMRAETERQGRLLDAMALKQGINPRDFDAKPETE